MFIFNLFPRVRRIPMQKHIPFRDFIITTSLAFLIFSQAAFSRTIDPSYQIATWSGFRTAAVSYTFDDNCSNQLALAVPMFNSYNMKLTLFTVSNWVTNWPALKAAASSGHEIASHTVDHTVLNTLSAANQEAELANSQIAITTNLPGGQCVSIAYPNCIEATESITAKYYIAARGCSGVVETATPANALNISSIVCGATGNYTTTSSLNDLANQAVSKKGWCVYLIHGIDGDGGYSPIASTVLKAHIGHMDSLSSTVWVSTFGNVFRYIKERDSVSVKEPTNDGSGIHVQVTDTLPNAIYNYPLTLKRTLPAGWTQAFAMQANRKIPCSIVSQAIQFDVVPNGGDIVISNSSTSILTDLPFTQNTFLQNISARRNSDKIILSFLHSPREDVNVAVFDARGKHLFNTMLKNSQPGEIQIPFSRHLACGNVFIVKVYNKEEAFAKQLILN